MAKKKKTPSMTPRLKAVELALDALQGEYEEYSEGNAEDDDFTTPGKQKKVAKQIAKLHNRLAKKAADLGVEDLDEDPE